VLRRRILIVDDDPRLLHVVSMYLTIEGYDVDAEPDGAEGLRALERARPDLVILDIMMPGIDGIEACRRIRANATTAQTPVLMFSALSEEAEAARLAGADGMLPKPFNLPALAEAVKTFFAARTAPS
jgi:two-component system OmpR family response regulator